MGKRKGTDYEEAVPNVGRRAVTPIARENQLIALSERRAEEQLKAGTASSQVITHYLKLGAQREREELEKELLRQKIETERAKTESYQSSKRIEELYAKALNAMRRYRGESVSEDEEVEQ